jgi:hypothetical protein
MFHLYLPCYQVIVHLTTQRNAIAMLNSRIQFLLKYLQDTQSGAIPVDQDIIRQISSLCRRSPILEKKAFDEQFSTVKFTMVYIKICIGDIDQSMYNIGIQ